MRKLIPVLLVSCWLAACVCIEFAPAPKDPPIDRNWERFNPPPTELDLDGCCIENPDADKEDLDLKRGPHVIMFDDHQNSRVGWEIERYDLYNQWGKVIASIKPNQHGTYLIRGVPRGCYTLRAIPKDWPWPSKPSNEGCTPGLKKGGIWT